jgi:hypothetical protein
MKRDPKDMPDWQRAVQIFYHLITATLIAAIVMGGFALLCVKTEPSGSATIAPEASTVFDRAQKDM